MSWQTADVYLNDTKIHYTRTGGDGPPLFFFHGFTDNGLTWAGYAAIFESEFDIIMPDFRGHGLSGPLTEGVSVELNAADMAALCAHLGFESVIVLGHSMGAAIGSQFAAHYPELVRALIVVDPLWRVESSESRPADLSGWRDNLANRKQKSREELIALVREENPVMLPAECEHLADAWLQFDLTTFDRFQRPPTNWQETAARIQCPTLLIYAEPERRGIVSPEAAQFAATIVPHLRSEQILDAGHCPQRDQPARFEEVLRAFLDEVR